MSAFCPNCKREFEGNPKYCNLCGYAFGGQDQPQSQQQQNILLHAAVPNTPEQVSAPGDGNPAPKPDRKSFIIKILAVAGGALIIIAALTIGLIFFANPVSSIMSSINSGNYQQAMDTYNSKVKGNSQREKDLEKQIKEELDKLYDSFQSETTTYDEAVDKLDTISKAKLSILYTEETRDKVTALNNSREAYKKAEEYLQGKDYQQALTELKKVIVSDPGYQRAQNMIQDTETKYKEDCLTKIDAAMDQKDYAKAIELINGMVQAIPDNADVTAKRDQYFKTIEEKSDFRMMSWGMTRTQVRAIETDSFYKENSKSLIYNTKIESHNFALFYDFNASGKLNGITLLAMDTHTTMLDYVNDYEELKLYFIGELGPQSESEEPWINNYYKGYPGLAIAAGHHYRTIKWQTQTSEIELSVFGVDDAIHIMMTYKSKEISDSV